jgi:hypothetical protein
MNENTEEEQMQCGGRGGVSRAARGRFDGFAYGIYALPPDADGASVLLKQDSSRLLLIRNVI